MASHSVKVGDGSAPSPAYGLGTAHFGKGAGKVDEELVEHVSNALKAGFTHLDNAEGYKCVLDPDDADANSNDVSVGEALRRSGADRSKLYITHKVTKSVDDIKGTLEKQLKNLGTDHVNLYLVHDPTEGDKFGLSISQVWQQAEEVQKLGLAKEIGVSNHRVHHLQELLKSAKVKPAVNQIEVHPYLVRTFSVDRLTLTDRRERRARRLPAEGGHQDRGLCGPVAAHSRQGWSR